MTVIVDTNVAVVANGHANQASLSCVSVCAQRLQAIMDGAYRLVLDSQWAILTEYKRNLQSSGQPGPGDQFLEWVLTNQANPQCCEVVPITPLEADARQFAEFPADPALARFDASDRKFVAVALAHPQRAPILNATDRDWWLHREALARHGLTIEFLCPVEMGVGTPRSRKTKV